MSCFSAHMDDTLELLDRLRIQRPENLCADAGYGSAENYQYLESRKIKAYVKYPGYYKEQKGKFKNSFDHRTLHYNQEDDYYVCPMGQHMNFIGQRQKEYPNGRVGTLHLYAASNCEGCPMRGQCYKSQSLNRIIEVDPKARHYQKLARKALRTDEGREKSIQRNIDVESVFGQLKQNRRFRRFRLTTINGAETEMGLLSLAHNFIKWHKILLKQGRPMPGCGKIDEKVLKMTG